MDTEPQLLLDGLTFAEAPRWRDGALYFSDMHGGRVVRLETSGANQTVLPMSNPSGLGWMPDGDMLIVSMEDRVLLRVRNGHARVHTDLSQLCEYHCNDMVVDDQGRAYVGNFGFDYEAGGQASPTRLVMVEPTGAARKVGGDLLFPNGMVITPDGKTLIVAETYGGQLTAFNIEPDGSLTNQRVWAKLETAPDGICLDADGCIWVACPVAPGRGFMLVAEGGEVKDRIAMEDRGGYACVLGGPERKQLFLLEAVDSRAGKVEAGNSRVRVVDVATAGAGLP